MKDNLTSSNLTRRSFIKRSVVAGVAVSSMTIFSGLVNASNTLDGGSETDRPVHFSCDVEECQVVDLPGGKEGLRCNMKCTKTYLDTGETVEMTGIAECNWDGEINDDNLGEWGGGDACNSVWEPES